METLWKQHGNKGEIIYMGFLEIETSKATYYFRCITFYKDLQRIEIQFDSGSKTRNEFIKFKKGTDIFLKEYYFEENENGAYLKSIKKDNGDYLYKLKELKQEI